MVLLGKPMVEQKNWQSLRWRTWRRRQCSDRSQNRNLASSYVCLVAHRTILWFSVWRWPPYPLHFWETEKITKICPNPGHVTNKKGFEGARRPPQKPPKILFSKKSSLNPNISKNYRNRARELGKRSKTVKFVKNLQTFPRIYKLCQNPTVGQPCPLL